MAALLLGAVAVDSWLSGRMKIDYVI